MSKRPNMLASVIREIIAPVLQRCPKECGMVSITEVEVSGDFSVATVYVSALDNTDRALQFLESRTNELQRKVGSIPRARLPKLRFRLDNRVEQGNRIDELLGELDE